MRAATLTLLVLMAGCAAPSTSKKPSPYRYTTNAPLLALGAHGREPQ